MGVTIPVFWIPRKSSNIVDLIHEVQKNFIIGMQFVSTENNPKSFGRFGPALIALKTPWGKKTCRKNKNIMTQVPSWWFEKY